MIEFHNDLLNDKNLTLILQVKLVKVLVWSALKYGAEA